MNAFLIFDERINADRVFTMSSTFSPLNGQIADGMDAAGFDKYKTVIVVGPSLACAQSVAESLRTQGEPMQVMWFEQSQEALEASPPGALVGVVFCHRSEKSCFDELDALRRALPDTPVLPWELPHAA